MDEKTAKLRICKKCLTRDLIGQEEYFRNLQEYIDNLDEKQKVTPDDYEKRLKICSECELLYEAMCRRCGCYVELRAALSNKNCPDAKW